MVKVMMPRASLSQGRTILDLLVGVCLATFAVSSCVDINGGAIEASWVLRTSDGRAISDCTCADPAIASVRFVALRVVGDGSVGDDACATHPGCVFSCHSQRGATPFDIPPGRYAISL